MGTEECPLITKMWDGGEEGNIYLNQPGHSVSLLAKASEQLKYREHYSLSGGKIYIKIQKKEITKQQNKTLKTKEPEPFQNGNFSLFCSRSAGNKLIHLLFSWMTPSTLSTVS